MHSEEAKRLERSVIAASSTTSGGGGGVMTGNTTRSNGRNLYYDSNQEQGSLDQSSLSRQHPQQQQQSQIPQEEQPYASTLSSVAWNTMGTDTAVVKKDHPDDDDDDDANETGRTRMESNAALLYKKRTQGESCSIYDNMDVQTKAEKYLETQDEYLDRPLDDRLPYSRSGTGTGKNSGGLDSVLWNCLKYIQKTLLSIHRYLYGDKIPPSEILRTLCLSSTLFFMIGGYWLLRSLKDPVLTALCGVTAIPKAKMLSVFVVLVVVSVYNRLLDNPNISKHSLFYIFGMFYFCLFTIISIFLSHPTIGLPNQTPSYGRLLGWISYCSIESFGSVMVSLFWSFCNSNFRLESAKACYGLLVATAQIGSILGPTFVQVCTKSMGVAKIYFVGALSMLLLQGTMFVYVKLYGSQGEINTNDSKDNHVKKQKHNGGGGGKNSAGVLEGLHLFVRHNYVKGIFAISCLFMVEVTIVDYTMKILARDHFAGLYPCTRGNSCWDVVQDTATGMSSEATEAFTTFMGLFGQATNTLSFFLSFFGTGAIIRRLGLRLALLLFPTLCLIVIVIVRLHPTLYVVFAAMMVLKANSYALNNPTKEMLYQPTSSAVRYKAKSWIDSFGARGSKALGSVVTNAFSDSASNLVHNGSLVGMAVASFLIWNARFMGRSFEKYVETGYVVGEDVDDDVLKNGDHFELAAGQNDVEDTSCAIYEDDEIKENVSDNSNEEEEEQEEEVEDESKDVSGQRVGRKAGKVVGAKTEMV
jgi:AAA family ATP:ADP antiporter